MTRQELNRVRTLLAETLLMHVFTLQSLSWPRSWSLRRAHSRSFAWSCCFKMLISSWVSSEVTFVFFLTLEASQLADHFPSRFCCSTTNVWYGSFSADWGLTSGVDGWLRLVDEGFSAPGFTYKSRRYKFIKTIACLHIDCDNLHFPPIYLNSKLQFSKKATSLQFYSHSAMRLFPVQTASVNKTAISLYFSCRLLAIYLYEVFNH